MKNENFVAKDKQESATSNLRVALFLIVCLATPFWWRKDFMFWTISVGILTKKFSLNQEKCISRACIAKDSIIHWGVHFPPKTPLPSKIRWNRRLTKCETMNFFEIFHCYVNPNVKRWNPLQEDEQWNPPIVWWFFRPRNVAKCEHSTQYWNWHESTNWNWHNSSLSHVRLLPPLTCMGCMCVGYARILKNSSGIILGDILVRRKQKKK